MCLWALSSTGHLHKCWGFQLLAEGVSALHQDPGTTQSSALRQHCQPKCGASRDVRRQRMLRIWHRQVGKGRSSFRNVLWCYKNTSECSPSLKECLSACSVRAEVPPGGGGSPGSWLWEGWAQSGWSHSVKRVWKAEHVGLQRGEMCASLHWRCFVSLTSPWDRLFAWQIKLSNQEEKKKRRRTGNRNRKSCSFLRSDRVKVHGKT